MNHHIAGLKIPVHKGLLHIFLNIGTSKQIIRQFFKFSLQTDLIEFKSGRFQETILEIVQVEHHHPATERRFRIADRPIRTTASLELKFRQKGNSPAKKVLHLCKGARLRCFGYHII